jgi:arginine/glutamate-rich protein 1
MEAKLIEEETARRVEEAVRKRVDEALTAESFVSSLKARIDLERK